MTRALLLLLLLAFASHSSAEELVLYGAGSLREALTAITADYSKATGIAVSTQFGSSGLMREKIEAGAEVDLFASADMGQALKLRQDGFAVSVVMFARNRLCAFATPDVGLTPADFAERLVDPKVKLGTSTPKADPGGDYTWKMFELIDKAHPGAFAILDRKAQKIIGGSIAPDPADPDPVASAFRRGQINVMIGYCSGASRMRADAPGVEPVPVPEAFAVGPECGLALASYANPAAVELAFAILSPEGQAKLESFGFAPIGMISGR
jgi:molybdate transport system substrate-binding protein